jgi:Cof subfamily protein (haloacid dehalogenase superfamily)
LKNRANKQIYISDLDGTLLRDDATLSAYSRDKLIELLEKGLNFTIASARSSVALKPILSSIPFRLPVIEINGAFITDIQTGEHLVINDMPKDVITDVVSRIRAHDLSPFMSAFNGTQDRLYYEKLINGGMQWRLDDRTESNDTRLTKTSDLQNHFDNRIVALTVIGTHDQIKPVALEMQNSYDGILQMHFFENPYSPPWNWLTIHDEKACKAHAVKELLDLTGFDQENLVVFGDNLNDANMFKMAKTAIAVENATDEIKSYANKVIGTNQDDSVIKYIANDIKGN